MNFANRNRDRLHTGPTTRARVTQSIVTSATQTGLLLRRQLWIWPIIAIIVLSIIGFGMRRSIERTLKRNLASQLQTLLDVQIATLKAWFDVQESNAATLANSKHVRDSAAAVTTAFQTDQLPHAQLALDHEIEPFLAPHDYVGYFVTDKSGRIIGASHEELVGREGVPEYDRFLSRALDGEVVVSPPFPSVVSLKTANGDLENGEPIMYVCAPIRDERFQPIGALALQIRPEKEFTALLQLGRIGKSGETYAFDENSLMVSNSRFDDDLILLGLLPDQPGARSILNVLVRDPGGNVTLGYRPQVKRSLLPPTKMVESSLAGNAAVDVEGYRDYRGVPVVGAWQWLPEYGIGVTTEVDVAEAFRPLVILKGTFWILYALLILCSVAIFVFSIIVARMRRAARLAAIEAKQLGQYVLDEKIGEGGMGVVYKGTHAMLRRPTAIKLLSADRVDDESIQRFEREVQITCQLNHPNTVMIHDYGRTPEEVFYYVMEFLHGIDLQTLVDKYGPQPEGRVIQILLQVCGSLYEAHSLGLVHRDIKPANIMLNRRGFRPDVVKVLDFGLVKAVDDSKQMQLTLGDRVAGTPLYMPPEAIQSPASVDARSDLYAVGAVGYFLLTGQPLFDAVNINELCRLQVEEVPIPPMERADIDVSTELEDVLMACLEKSKSKRPQSARDLEHVLEKCGRVEEWTFETAEGWWGRHERGGGVTRDALSLPSGRSASGQDALTTQTKQPLRENPPAR